MKDKEINLDDLRQFDYLNELVDKKLWKLGLIERGEDSSPHSSDDEANASKNCKEKVTGKISVSDSSESDSDSDS